MSVIEPISVEKLFVYWGKETGLHDLVENINEAMICLDLVREGWIVNIQIHDICYEGTATRFSKKEKGKPTYIEGIESNNLCEVILRLAIAIRNVESAVPQSQ